MKIPVYQIDAFSAKAFGGNPAAVCLLSAWLPDELLQSVAVENALPATAYLVPTGDDRYDIRWFTPTRELELCGHATLASGHVVFERLRPELRTVTFASRGGPLHVSSADGRIVLDFPARPAQPCPVPAGIVEALGAAPEQTLHGSSLVAVYASENDVRTMTLDMAAIGRLDAHGVIVTAPGTDADFVSRFFAPNMGVPEDQVTGSAHCALTPYWSARLGKNALHARQLSRRGGELWLEMAGDRVRLAGYAAPFLEGAIEI